ncbi:hypothetical protein Y032_0481g2261 [Ancylostoma ceylanicum]|uniref:Uncharacterized protein n=1 Tax=Ancylostoma ceylanicum TaxID=53326 RepID=A0A016WWX6_9BILA|nr:hypothetical protein Y032_0481g2261 [Ancylostoma ceylanicum]
MDIGRRLEEVYKGNARVRVCPRHYPHVQNNSPTSPPPPPFPRAYLSRPEQQPEVLPHCDPSLTKMLLRYLDGPSSLTVRVPAWLPPDWFSRYRHPGESRTTLMRGLIRFQLSV